jgi:hypothetical protein
VVRSFSYHRQVVAHLKGQVALWKFFSTDSDQAEEFQQFKTELLKNTYRLEPDVEPSIYASIDKAKTALQISHKVSVYQLLVSTELNASIYMLPEEAHIVLSGGMIKLMDSAEMEAILAHELAHLKFFAEDGGDYRIASRVLDALSTHAGAPPEYLETARLFNLYKELYCDQVALRVAGDIMPVVSALVKIDTGLEHVSAESYLRQAAEIFEVVEVKSEHITHPEIFIRAYALQAFQSFPGDTETKINMVIQGRCKLRELDVFSRETLYGVSRRVVTAMLASSDLQTDTLLNLAKQYFPDFRPGNEAGLLPDDSAASNFDESSKVYLAYLLLDFALADRAVERDAYPQAYALAQLLGVGDTMKEVTKKELKLSEKKFNERYKKTLAQHA